MGFKFQKQHTSLGSRNSEMIRKGEGFENAAHYRQRPKRWLVKTLTLGV